MEAQKAESTVVPKAEPSAPWPCPKLSTYRQTRQVAALRGRAAISLMQS